MDKKEFRVGVTKDYNMFEFLDTNRQPNTRIIKKLEKSIKEHGVQIPIIVNDKKQIYKFHQMLIVQIHYYQNFH